MLKTTYHVLIVEDSPTQAAVAVEAVACLFGHVDRSRSASAVALQRLEAFA